MTYAAILFFGLVMFCGGFVAGTAFTAYVLLGTKPPHQKSDGSGKGFGV